MLTGEYNAVGKRHVITQGRDGNRASEAVPNVDNFRGRYLASILTDSHEARQLLENSNLVRQLGSIARNSVVVRVSGEKKFSLKPGVRSLLCGRSNTETVVGQNGIALAYSPVYEAVRGVQMGVPVSMYIW